MKEKMVVGGSSVTAGQLEDFFRQIKDGSLGSEELQAILEHRNPWLEVDFDWGVFYMKYLGLTFSSTGLKIPERPEKGNWRLLVILSRLTNNKVYQACTKQFPCWKYAEDLDKAVLTNERDPKNDSYAIWVRDTAEADEVHKNKSADMIKEAGLKTETLLERMLHELVYFSETGNHLDVNNVTLCSGSCGLADEVPSARWYDHRFSVSWCNAGDQGGGWRAREVVC